MTVISEHSEREIIQVNTLEVKSGRVAKISPLGDDIASVRLVQGVEHGRITVNSDNSFALVLTTTDFVGAQNFRYEAVDSNGKTSLHEINLIVSEGTQANGWGTGQNHYMLETDADDKIVVEAGSNHVEIHISGSDGALSREDIAALEGVDPEEVTGQWLANLGRYGGSPETALDSLVGMELWRVLTPNDSRTSNWLLFERGYEYQDLGRIFMEGASGESELKPLFIGAFGSGEKPLIKDQLLQFQDTSANFVVEDLHFAARVVFLDAQNALLNQVTFNDSLSTQHSQGVTIRNSSFIDIVRDEPVNGNEWEAHLDRISGYYSHNVQGLLLEGNLFDKIGWEEGYGQNGHTIGVQPPSKYSQNIYINYENEDVTLRDTISMRAASFGAQVRSGGFIEGNAFLDNNAAVFFAGGGAEATGSYTLLSSNIVTSGAHKEAVQIGAKTLGIWDKALDSSYIGNIVAHLADPNSNELEWKKVTNDGILSDHEQFFDDTIVHKWVGSEKVWGDLITNQNNESLDQETLDQTTIQKFTAAILGKDNASIADLANHLRGVNEDESDEETADAKSIVHFFETGFGIAREERETATSVRFQPNEIGEGVRWDNRLNWATGDIPGKFEEDDVNLAGNEVFLGGNVSIGSLSFGESGALNVYGGKLKLSSGILADSEGELNISGAGQVWTSIAGLNGKMTVNVEGGRFVNIGQVEGAELHASSGQIILASNGGEFYVTDGNSLVVESDATVGFDGDSDDLASLSFHRGSSLVFDVTDGDIGKISEFSSGAFGDSSAVNSQVILGGAELVLELSNFTPIHGEEYTLIDADEIQGVFSTVRAIGLSEHDIYVEVDRLEGNMTLSFEEGDGSVHFEGILIDRAPQIDEEILQSFLELPPHVSRMMNMGLSEYSFSTEMSDGIAYRTVFSGDTVVARQRYREAPDGTHSTETTTYKDGERVHEFTTYSDGRTREEFYELGSLTLVRTSHVEEKSEKRVVEVRFDESGSRKEKTTYYHNDAVRREFLDNDIVFQIELSSGEDPNISMSDNPWEIRKILYDHTNGRVLKETIWDDGSYRAELISEDGHKFGVETDNWSVVGTASQTWHTLGLGLEHSSGHGALEMEGTSNDDSSSKMDESGEDANLLRIANFMSDFENSILGGNLQEIASKLSETSDHRHFGLLATEHFERSRIMELSEMDFSHNGIFLSALNPWDVTGLEIRSVSINGSAIDGDMATQAYFVQEYGKSEYTLPTTEYDIANKFGVSVAGMNGAIFSNISRFIGTEARDVFLGCARNEVFSSAAGDDFIFAAEGDDTLEGGMGADHIDGGEGYDIALFTGNIGRYQISENDDAIFVEDLVFGDVDEIFNVEVLKFDDATIEVSLLF